MHTLVVPLGDRSYPIVFARPGETLAEALPASSSVMVVSDDRTIPHADALASSIGDKPVSRHVVPAGEASKSLAQLDRLYTALAAMPADRRTTVVAVGGGVIGDLAGFAAATYNRGLRLVMVPTTLLAMVDSSVGGKTGINIPAGKNLVGAFHQPVLVWIDPTFLHSLPDREYRSGLAEVVKYGVIADADFFAELEGNVEPILSRDPDVVVRVVRRCCAIKADVVSRDEFETTGLRATLNYGHTFAHAFEAVAGYGSWRHGEAVAAGMVCAARLAERIGMIDASPARRQADLLARMGLPTAPDRAWPIDRLIDAMRRDKKTLGGQLRFVLPTRLGEVRLVDGIDERDVRAVLGP
jgi:3-dehydroquinate synthase